MNRERKVSEYRTKYRSSILPKLNELSPTVPKTKLIEKKSNSFNNITSTVVQIDDELKQVHFIFYIFVYFFNLNF